MGHSITVVEARFAIRADNAAPAFRAVRGMAERRGPSYDGRWAWVDSDELRRSQNLADALAAWGYRVKQDADWNVVGVERELESLGDEDALFETLAPFVEAGSFVHVCDRDGDHWRWWFDGDRVAVQHGRVVFDGEGKTDG